MKNASHDIATAAAMLERARRILELTYHDWRLHEQPRRRGKATRKQEGMLARYSREHSFSATPQDTMRAYA